jgi:ssDNA-binding Zn-finger/Zn-ribbon topoisomerase 1
MVKECKICKNPMRLGRSINDEFWYCADFPYCDGKEKVKLKKDVKDKEMSSM